MLSRTVLRYPPKYLAVYHCCFMYLRYTLFLRRRAGKSLACFSLKDESILGTSRFRWNAPQSEKNVVI